MSAVEQDGVAVETGRVLMLLPEEINLPELTNVRPFTSRAETEADIRELQALMKSIEEEGQIQPIVVVERVVEGENGTGPRFDVVAGRRRLRAVTMHNLSADEPMRIKAVLGDTAKNVSNLFRRAAHENVLRVGINAIDFAYNCREVRANMKFKGAKGTKQVAEFLGVSEAQVTQHEKLLGLSEGFQQAIAEGRLSREGAYELLKVKEGDRQAVYDAAVAAQAAELVGPEAGGGVSVVGEGAVVRSGWALAEGTVKGVEEALVDVLVDEDPLGVDEPDTTAPIENNQPANTSGKKKGKASGAAKKGGVKAKHIKEAARVADPGVKSSRSRKEMLEFFAGCMGPAYGYADGVVHKFCAKFSEWAAGDVQDRALENAFKAMVEGAPRGNAPKPIEKKAGSVVTGVAGKTVVKAGKHPPKLKK